mgnify:CR=1 FL=1
MSKVERGDSSLRDVSAASVLYIYELQRRAALANARRRPSPLAEREPPRISLLIWLAFDAVLLAYGLAALVLLRVVP